MRVFQGIGGRPALTWTAVRTRGRPILLSLSVAPSPITGECYIKHQYGPYSTHLDDAIAELEASGDLVVSQEESQASGADENYDDYDGIADRTRLIGCIIVHCDALFSTRRGLVTRKTRRASLSGAITGV